MFGFTGAVFKPDFWPNYENFLSNWRKRKTHRDPHGATAGSGQGRAGHLDLATSIKKVVAKDGGFLEGRRFRCFAKLRDICRLSGRNTSFPAKTRRENSQTGLLSAIDRF